MGTGWQLYKGGVKSNCRGKALDHGVLIVGYTPDYWKVKNSWGGSWGESGYIRLTRSGNECGILNAAVYPEVGAPTPHPTPTPSPTPTPTPSPTPTPGQCHAISALV